MCQNFSAWSFGRSKLQKAPNAKFFEACSCRVLSRRLHALMMNYTKPAKETARDASVWSTLTVIQDKRAHTFVAQTVSFDNSLAAVWNGFTWVCRESCWRSTRHDTRPSLIGILKRANFPSPQGRIRKQKKSLTLHCMCSETEARDDCDLFHLDFVLTTTQYGLASSNLYSQENVNLNLLHWWPKIK